MPPDCAPILGSSLKCKKKPRKELNARTKAISHAKHVTCLYNSFSILRSTELEREIKNVIPQIRELLLSD